MSRRARVILASVAVLVLGFVLLPRLARRIDSALDPVWEKAAANDARYREMTNALRIASEVSPEHPTRRLYEECKAALTEAGYIETREFPMKRSFERRQSVNAFFASFRKRFPGLECAVQGMKSGEPPVIVVTARPDDFGAIERFVSQYDPAK